MVKRINIVERSKNFRIPGRLEVSWNRWGIAAEVIFDSNNDDYASPSKPSWPWMIHLHLGPWNVFWHFPFSYRPKSGKPDWQRNWQQWGGLLFEDSLHLHWNECTKVWGLPWKAKIFQRHEVRRVDESWAPFVGSWERDKEPDGRQELNFSYIYTLRSGETQTRTATVYVQRYAHRPKWFTWTRLFETVRQSISVEFSDEVGEQTGSWKGGCVGCSWGMLPGETAEESLRRMERERKFE